MEEATSDDPHKGHPRKVRSWKLEVGPGQTTKNTVGLLGCVTPLEDIVTGEDSSRSTQVTKSTGGTAVRPGEMTQWVKSL